MTWFRAGTPDETTPDQSRAPPYSCMHTPTKALHAVQNCFPLSVPVVQAYDMYKKMEVLRPSASTATEMTKFHSNDYVNFMQNVRHQMAFGQARTVQTSLNDPVQVTPDNYQDAKFAQQLKRFSVGEDCPVFDGLYRSLSALLL